MLVRLGVLSGGYLLSKVWLGQHCRSGFNRYPGFRAFDSEPRSLGPYQWMIMDSHVSRKAQCYLPFLADPGLPSKGPRPPAVGHLGGQIVTAQPWLLWTSSPARESPVFQLMVLWFPGIDGKRQMEPSLRGKAGYSLAPGHVDHHWVFVLGDTENLGSIHCSPF